MEVDGILLAYDKRVFNEIGLVDFIVADRKLDAVCRELVLVLIPESRVAVETGYAVYSGVNQRITHASKIASEKFYLVEHAHESYRGAVHGRYAVLSQGKGVCRGERIAEDGKCIFSLTVLQQCSLVRLTFKGRIIFLRLFGRVWRRKDLALVGFVAAVGGKPFPVLAVNLHHRVQIRKLTALPGG